MTPNTPPETTAAELLELADAIHAICDSHSHESGRQKTALDDACTAIRELAALKAQQPSGAQAGLLGRMAKALRMAHAYIQGNGAYEDWQVVDVLTEYDASPLPGDGGAACHNYLSVGDGDIDCARCGERFSSHSDQAIEPPPQQPVAARAVTPEIVMCALRAFEPTRDWSKDGGFPTVGYQFERMRAALEAIAPMLGQPQSPEAK